jgi:hypothetical protein
MPRARRRCLSRRTGLHGLPAFRPVTDAELAAVRSLRNELTSRWHALPPGATLHVPFPATTHEVTP